MFRRKKNQENITFVTKSTYEIPQSVMHRLDNAEAGKDAKAFFVEFLKERNRTQLLDIGDNIWFKQHKYYDWLWEALMDEEWKRTYPESKNLWEHTLPSLIYDKIPFKDLPKERVDLKSLLAQIDGIQKKVDFLTGLFESMEVTMTGKQALKLVPK